MTISHTGKQHKGRLSRIPGVNPERRDVTYLSHRDGEQRPQLLPVLGLAGVVEGVPQLQRHGVRLALGHDHRTAVTEQD